MSVLNKKVNSNLIQIINSYMFYSDNEMILFFNEWKLKFSVTILFINNVFGYTKYDSRLYIRPCLYCKIKKKKSSNSHNIFDCLKYNIDLDKLCSKIKKYNKI